MHYTYLRLLHETTKLNECHNIIGILKWQLITADFKHRHTINLALRSFENHRR